MIRAAAAVIAATAIHGGADAAQSCAVDRIEISTTAEADAAAAFSIEVASTRESRAKGLMFRETMPADHGMLFVYDRAEEVAFWMKNTPLPLDIIFINRRGVVCSIAARTTPFSLDAIPSGCAAQTVLEINAGRAAELGVTVGAVARHPSIEKPVWPCE